MVKIPIEKDKADQSKWIRVLDRRRRHLFGLKQRELAM